MKDRKRYVTFKSSKSELKNQIHLCLSINTPTNAQLIWNARNNTYQHLSLFYTFYTVHCGKLLKQTPTNAPVVYLSSLIYSHLHVSVVSRPSSGCPLLKTMGYNVCIRPRYSFYNVSPNSKIIVLYAKKLKIYVKKFCVSVSYGDQVGTDTHTVTHCIL